MGLRGVGVAARRPAPTFPCRSGRDMPRRTLLPPGPAATWPATSGSAASDGAREAVGQSPRHAARLPATRQADDTPPGARGARRGGFLWRPFSLLLEWFPEAGDSEVSLQALFSSGWAALGRHWPQEGGVPLTWEGNDLGRDSSI